MIAGKQKEIVEQISALITQGSNLLDSLQNEWHPKEFKIALKNQMAFEDVQVDNLLKSLPNFKAEYQKWYSKAQSVVKIVIPDRYLDFNSHYEYKGSRKEIDFQNYMIRDYLQGLVVTSRGETKVNGSAAIPEFSQQLNILRAAKDAIGSVILNIRQVLQAEMFDSELASAVGLAKAGFLRASGAVCGVVLEKHLIQVCDTHAIVIKKKNPGISDLNELLKEAGVISVPQWRFIQHLGDIRNICDHAKSQEPKTAEIDDLTAGTSKIIKTVF
jgi:hypothetical protein